MSDSALNRGGGSEQSRVRAIEELGAMARGEYRDEDELRDFDPTQEGGGGPCERCGYIQEPWRYSRFCQACIWDEAGAR